VLWIWPLVSNRWISLTYPNGVDNNIIFDQLTTNFQAGLSLVGTMPNPQRFDLGKRWTWIIKQNLNYTILKIVVLSLHYLLCISSSDFQKNCVLLSNILTELNRKTFLTKYKLTKLYLLGTRPNLLRFKYDWNVYIVQSCQLIPPNYNLHNII
jgi:hypothetical protein